MKLGSAWRRSVKLADEAFVTAGASSAFDRRAFNKAGATTNRRPAAAGVEASEPLHVLLAPPGGGNIGDQAMVEAFLEGTSGQVAIIVREPDAISIPPAHQVRAHFVVSPYLLYSNGSAHYRAIAAFRHLLEDAASFSVIGADIMDGKYSLRASVRRANLAEYAASMGINSRILGFSWNGNPRQAARSALAAAAAKGSVPMLREPISAGRAREHGVMGVREVADIVFSATSVDHGIVERIGLDSSDIRPIVIVNVSGLIGRTLDQVGEYELVVSRLRELGRRILLLPHVKSRLADDLVACRAVYERVGSDGVVFVDRLLAPAEIRGLTAASEFVITGRMHLAIMALSHGKPAITLSTQGKVEGLMRLFGSEELSVNPVPGFGTQIVRVIETIVAPGGDTAGRIARHLPAVRGLSELNFAGLTR